MHVYIHTSMPEIICCNNDVCMYFEKQCMLISFILWFYKYLNDVGLQQCFFKYHTVKVTASRGTPNDFSQLPPSSKDEGVNNDNSKYYHTWLLGRINPPLEGITCK